MPGNVRHYQESVTKELDIVKNRVRNLIGDAHWGEEGRFKEAVLKNALRRVLPNNLSVGTGFILKAVGSNDNDNKLSKQIDIIIYDNTYPVLFSEGDFIITTFSNVRGIIEVKTRLDHNSFRTTLRHLDSSLRDFITDLQASDARKIFTGIFAFDFSGNIHSDAIDEALVQSKRIVNHVSLGKDLFIRHWNQADRVRLAVDVLCETDFYNVYEINDLSFSYFISNLIDIASSADGLEDRYWFAFPIEGTKELNRIRNICLPPAG